MKKINPKQVHETLGKFILCDGYDMVVDTEKSHGSYLYDAKHKKEYLDFFSFFASMPLGFNHPKMNNKKFVEEIGKVALHNVSNSDFYTTTMAEFVQMMGEVAMPKYMKKMFFISGGALAVENGLKTAFDWKVRKNFAKGIKKELGTKIIHFKQSFHGRTGYTLSLTNTADPRKYQYFPMFDWPRIDNPKVEFPLNEANLKKVKEAEKKAIAQITEACKKHKDDIAGLLIEPIQGEGGDNHFRKEFFAELRKLADKYEFLLILDEVQSGGGITGKMWAHEHYGLKPDIICFGKKLQVCGIMVGDRVLEVPQNVFVESSRINSTWGGSVVDMKRATRYLEIIRDEKLVDNAKKMGKLMVSGLEKIAKKTKKISNIRGVGLFIAFDLENGEMRNKFLKDCKEKENMLVLPCGDCSVRFRPYLDVKESEITEGLKKIEKVLS
ncbi:MAG: L-lysine 6-transaminase [bacterium]